VKAVPQPGVQAAFVRLQVGVADAQLLETEFAAPGLDPSRQRGQAIGVKPGLLPGGS
jgi:hypothetical protein